MDTDELTKENTQLRESLESVKKKLTLLEEKREGTEGETRHSYAGESAQTESNEGDKGNHYDYSKPFAEQVEDWKNGKIPQRDTLILGGTPEVLRKIGLSSLPMTMDQTHVDYAINGTKNADHSLGEEILKKLPDLIAHPVAVIESQTRPDDSVMVIVSAIVNGSQTMAAINIGGQGMANGISIDANLANNVQGRKNAISKLLAEAIQKELDGKRPSITSTKKKPRSCLAGPGCNSPGRHYRTASNTVYSIQTLLSIWNTFHKRKRDNFGTGLGRARSSIRTARRN